MLRQVRALSRRGPHRGQIFLSCFDQIRQTVHRHVAAEAIGRDQQILRIGNGFGRTRSQLHGFGRRDIEGIRGEQQQRQTCQRG